VLRGQPEPVEHAPWGARALNGGAGRNNCRQAERRSCQMRAGISR
jgi:hypothetical protein